MRDTELYQNLLGIVSPWSVESVTMDVEKQRMDVTVMHPPKILFACPECGIESPVFDHAEERVWRHLDSCQFFTYLHARVPRISCATHGVRQVSVPWAEARGRFTKLFERLAIDVLRACDLTNAAALLRITWDEARGIQERAVERGLARKGEKPLVDIGVDEKAFAKGHQYMTLVCDLREGTIEYAGEGRKTETLEAFYQTLTPEQRNGIQAVSMDMWDPFFQATLRHIPDAWEKIVFDRYHIMSHVGKAVDTVRKRETRDGKTPELKGSKYLWLYSKENLPETQQDRFDALRSLNLKVGRAWAMKEDLRTLWSLPSVREARTFWKRWFWWATHSRLKPMREVAHLIKRHLSNVLTYITHPITNATSEGLNSKIQTIKKRATGFRNKERFKIAIYFHCGGLNLYPS
ncbi:MAG: ISL3 family transposase [Leptospirales bacterium]